MKRLLTLAAMVAAGLAVIAAAWHAPQWWRARRFDQAQERATVPMRDQLERETRRLKEEILRLDQTVWANEVLAVRHEETVVRLWDLLRASPDKLAVLRRFPFESLALPAPAATNHHVHGVTEIVCSGAARNLTQEQFHALLGRWQGAGFRLVQCEWHHERFDPPASAPARSVFAVEFHATNAITGSRVIIAGDLEIEWASTADKDGLFPAHRLALPRCTALERSGPPAFVEVLGPNGRNPPFPFGNDPVLACDLDRDGLPELLLPEQNALWWNRGEGRFAQEPLCAQPAFDPDHPDKQVSAAVVADFDGDGRPDLAVAGRGAGVTLFAGGADGRFRAAGRRIFKPSHSFILPQVMTAGDINGDGRLDLWLSQYKVPAELGAMPTPFWDSNDGFPGYLLRQEKDGAFTDATAEAGLDPKRYRRAYGASFIDLDEDGDLDLLVSSDYAGVDVYRNDGRGRFTDVTATAVDERHLFGMGHAFGDFNGDGRLDFYVTGMDPATPRRLDHMGLARAEFPEHTRLRSVMAQGSRLYLGSGHATFHQTALSDDVARSGWSWGTAAFDFANDGLPDIYVANGHISRHTARNYSTRSWTHEVYLGNSRPNLALRQVFDDPSLPHLSTMSFEGFQHNKLYLNASGARFLNVGFLFDVGFEYDARCVLAEDFDADGRVDLIVSDFIHGRTRRGEAGNLHLYRNVWPSTNHWIGVRLCDEPGLSPAGARVMVQASGKEQFALIVSGDSYSAQHSTTRHFGLGGADRVDAIKVRWQTGIVTTIHNPAVDRYHAVRVSSK